MFGQTVAFATVSDIRIRNIGGEPRCANPTACPLSQVRAGTAVRIKQLSVPPDVTHRLREMGFCEEQKIKLLSQNTSIICQVCNVRMGISTALAERILVEPLPPATDRAA
jgi:ferrous iron transport protein A